MIRWYTYISVKWSLHSGLCTYLSLPFDREQNMSILTTPNQHHSGILTKDSKSRKRNKKAYRLERKKITPRRNEWKCHGLIKKARTKQWVKQHYKIETSIIFLYISSEQMEIKIYKTVPFIVAQKKLNTYIEISQNRWRIYILETTKH